MRSGARVCVRMRLYASACLCLRACMCVCVCVCLRVCACGHMCWSALGDACARACARANCCLRMRAFEHLEFDLEVHQRLRIHPIKPQPPQPTPTRIGNSSTGTKRRTVLTAKPLGKGTNKQTNKQTNKLDPTRSSSALADRTRGFACLLVCLFVCLCFVRALRDRACSFVRGGNRRTLHAKP